MPANRPIKSDETLFAIVESIRDLGRVGVTELANELGMSKGSVHHHLSTMEDYGYVTKSNGTYQLGLQFFDIGIDVRNQYDLNEVAKTELNNLVERTGEAGWYFVEEGGRGMFIGGHAAQRPMNEDVVIGTWKYLHCCAAGKAILAHLPEDEVECIIDTHGLPAMTENTITDRDTLMEELDNIREQGYALNLREENDALNAVSVPIFAESELIGSLGLGGAAHRVNREYCETNLVPEILKSANEIQLNLVYK